VIKFLPQAGRPRARRDLPILQNARRRTSRGAGHAGTAGSPPRPCRHWGGSAVFRDPPKCGSRRHGRDVRNDAAPLLRAGWV